MLSFLAGQDVTAKSVDVALKDVTAVLNERPNNEIALKLRAKMHTAIGNNEACVADCTTGLAHEKKRGNASSSAAASRKRKDRDYVDFLALRAHAYDRMGKYREAVRDFETAASRLQGVDDEMRCARARVCVIFMGGAKGVRCTLSIGRNNHRLSAGCAASS